MDFLVRPIRPAYVVANHPTPTIQCSRHKSRIECVQKVAKILAAKATYHPMWYVLFGMRSDKEDQVKCGEQQCGQKLNLAGCEKARMTQNGKV
jgi:hypothetical protein